MKKAVFTLAIFVMAFGNMGFAQSKAELRMNTTKQIFKQYGLVRESSIVPQYADFYESFGTHRRTTYYYDESEFTLTEEITEVYEDFWQNESRVAYEYDFYGNVFEKLDQEWDGNDWENVVLVSYAYDGDVLSEDIYQTYSDGQWVNLIKEVYNYNGDVWTVLVWEWNGTTWTSSVLNTYTRDNNTIVHVMQYMQGGAWQNDEKYIYTLDFDENVTEILMQEWTGTEWADKEKTTYLYEDGVYTDQYVQEWNGSAWLDEYHYTFDYDAMGNAKHGLCFAYGGYDWAPADGDIDMAYGYNADAKSFYGSEVEMLYVDLTAVNENTQMVDVKVYPVPAENELFIQADGFQKAEIYSVMGQKLMESNVNILNVSTLPAGIYLLKVYDLAGKCATQRVVVK